MYIYDVSCASESFSLASTVLYYVYSAALPELHVWPAPASAARRPLAAHSRARRPLAFATKCSECRFGCISSKNQDVVVILNPVWHGGNTFISLTFIDHFTGNGRGSPMIMPHLCLSSSKKLSIGAFKCSLLGAYRILKEIKVFSPALTQVLRSCRKG